MAADIESLWTDLKHARSYVIVAHHFALYWPHVASTAPEYAASLAAEGRARDALRRAGVEPPAPIEPRCDVSERRQDEEKEHREKKARRSAERREWWRVNILGAKP